MDVADVLDVLVRWRGCARHLVLVVERAHDLLELGGELDALRAPVSSATAVPRRKPVKGRERQRNDSSATVKGGERHLHLRRVVEAVAANTPAHKDGRVHGWCHEDGHCAMLPGGLSGCVRGWTAGPRRGCAPAGAISSRLVFHRSSLISSLILSLVSTPLLSHIFSYLLPPPAALRSPLSFRATHANGQAVCTHSMPLTPPCLSASVCSAAAGQGWYQPANDAGMHCASGPPKRHGMVRARRETARPHNPDLEFRGRCRRPESPLGAGPGRVAMGFDCARTCAPVLPSRTGSAWRRSQRRCPSLPSCRSRGSRRSAAQPKR